jgi:SAM-dependent methyltransferase
LELFWCDTCRFAFQPPEAVDARSKYGVDYFDEYSMGEHYSKDEAARKREAAKRVQLLQSNKPVPGRLLEIGCAAGFFLSAAQSAGWSVVGVEPSEAIAAEARERSRAEVHVGFVEDVDLRGQQFDAVCGWHVLEHIPTPLPLLRSLTQALLPDGIVMFEVPNFMSVISQQNGPSWRYLDPQHHVAQYSPVALRELLERANLASVETDTIPMWHYGATLGWLKPRPLLRRVQQAAREHSTTFGSDASKYELLRAIGTVR